MSDGLLLDTHIALWLDHDHPRLRQPTRALIDDHWRGGGRVFISAISAWEIAMLMDSGAFQLDVPAAAWMERFLARPGIEAAPLTHAPAARAYDLRDFERRDPADRLLIATAIELRCPLVTYDESILRFGRTHGVRYGFSVLD